MCVCVYIYIYIYIYIYDISRLRVKDTCTEFYENVVYGLATDTRVTFERGLHIRRSVTS